MGDDVCMRACARPRVLFKYWNTFIYFWNLSVAYTHLFHHGFFNSFSIQTFFFLLFIASNSFSIRTQTHQLVSDYNFNLIFHDIEWIQLNRMYFWIVMCLTRELYIKRRCRFTTKSEHIFLQTYIIFVNASSSSPISTTVKQYSSNWKFFSLSLSGYKEHAYFTYCSN